MNQLRSKGTFTDVIPLNGDVSLYLFQKDSPDTLVPLYEHSNQTQWRGVHTLAKLLCDGRAYSRITTFTTLKASTVVNPDSNGNNSAIRQSPPVVSINSISVVHGICTVYTNEPHSLNVGDAFYIGGTQQYNNSAYFNNYFTPFSVKSVLNTNAFTFAFPVSYSPEYTGWITSDLQSLGENNGLYLPGEHTQPALISECSSFSVLYPSKAQGRQYVSCIGVFPDSPPSPAEGVPGTFYHFGLYMSSYKDIDETLFAYHFVSGGISYSNEAGLKIIWKIWLSPPETA
jgi:hypothetical protein